MGNRLPYIDGVKILVITDISTSAAALRTGKADFGTVIPADDAKTLMHEVPEFKYTTYMSSYPYVIAMRIDNTELPYGYKKVRQALMMATDFNVLKDGFYGGSAEILAIPVSSEAKGAYMPLEDMPESAQALYRYNPEKAQELLAEAGYPDGFTAKMILWSATITPTWLLFCRICGLRQVSTWSSSPGRQLHSFLLFIPGLIRI